MVTLTERGLYCAPGDFYIDPWEPVERAVITHAHPDRLIPGSAVYITAQPGAALLRAGIGPDAGVEAVDYGAALARDGVRVSLYPAGHILGSAQVRIERGGEVWVVSGDYKLQPDPTCAPFEPVRCHTFLTEASFGLPVFRWPPAADVFAQIDAWWRANQEAGKASVLFANPVGKAQRLLAGVDVGTGPIFAHPVVEAVNEVYRQAGVALPAPEAAPEWKRALIVAPPMASNSPWLRPFGRISTALASGWMRVRGTRRRRSLDRGFVLSEHPDWPRLLETAAATGATRVLSTGRFAGPLARWLSEQGTGAQAIETRAPAEEDE